MPQEQRALRALAPEPDGVRERADRRRVTCVAKSARRQKGGAFGAATQHGRHRRILHRAEVVSQSNGVVAYVPGQALLRGYAKPRISTDF